MFNFKNFRFTIICNSSQNKLSWKEACQAAGSFYSYSLSKSLLSMTGTWAVLCSRAIPKLPFRLHKKSAIRISQCCHMTWIINDKLSNDTKTMVEDLSRPDKVTNFVIALNEFKWTLFPLFN